MDRSTAAAAATETKERLDFSNEESGKLGVTALTVAEVDMEDLASNTAGVSNTAHRRPEPRSVRNRQRRASRDGTGVPAGWVVVVRASDLVALCEVADDGQQLRPRIVQPLRRRAATCNTTHLDAVRTQPARAVVCKRWCAYGAQTVVSVLRLNQLEPCPTCRR